MEKGSMYKYLKNRYKEVYVIKPMIAILIFCFICLSQYNNIRSHWLSPYISLSPAFASTWRENTGGALRIENVLEETIFQDANNPMKLYLVYVVTTGNNFVTVCLDETDYELMLKMRERMFDADASEPLIVDGSFHDNFDMRISRAYKNIEGYNEIKYVFYVDRKSQIPIIVSVVLIGFGSIFLIWGLLKLRKGKNHVYMKSILETVHNSPNPQDTIRHFDELFSDAKPNQRFVINSYYMVHMRYSAVEVLDLNDVVWIYGKKKKEKNLTEKVGETVLTYALPFGAYSLAQGLSGERQEEGASITILKKDGFYIRYYFDLDDREMETYMNKLCECAPFFYFGYSDQLYNVYVNDRARMIENVEKARARYFQEHNLN